MSEESDNAVERKSRRFWRSLRRDLRALPFAILPGALFYGMVRYGSSAQDDVIFAAAFLVLALFSPIVTLRARTLSAAVTAAGFMAMVAQALDGQISMVGGRLFMPLPIVAIFGTLSALMCVAIAVFSKRWLLWTQPMIAAAVLIWNDQIATNSFAMACAAAAVPLMARLYLKYRRVAQAEDGNFQP